MTNQFDELTKSMAQSVTRRGALKTLGLGLACLTLTRLLALPAVAGDLRLRPLTELSRPNAVGTCDDGFISLPGTWTLDDAFEPFLVVNPVNRKNVVAAWTQGLFQNIIAAVSLDGGQTWRQVPIPLTLCSGGPFLGAGDVRLEFAPNGILYVIAVVGNDLDTRGVAVSKSTDGGLHWSAPVSLTDSTSFVPNDVPVITADPTDPRYLYAIWDGLDAAGGGPAVFSRTTDGGRTWKRARILVQTQPEDFVQFSQILVLPDGTLVDVYELVDGVQGSVSLQVVRSRDRGQTWSSPTLATTMLPVVTTDPETGQFVGDPFNPSLALDKRNGFLYAVWGDGRFSNSAYNDIAFSMSANGGRNWSAPIRVNQTPLNIPAANRHSFLPTIAVAEDGTIGVTHYDFRFNDPTPGLPTDYWLVRCHPSSAKPATDPANWGNEVRLTDTSFNMEACGIIIDEFRPGEYYGLAAVGGDFLSTFTQVDCDGITSIFFRRVGK
jgi:photosystem II stability/assembly factor-like uncharacterized protein